MPYKDPEVRRMKQAEYRSAHREKIRAKQRERHATIRDEKREYKREYYVANRERLLAEMREKNAERPEINRARAAAWRSAHPTKAAEQRRRYGLTGRESQTADYVAILRNDPCGYCGSTAGDADHITPRSRGGDDCWSNLTAACRRCNSSKNASPLLTWMAIR